MGLGEGGVLQERAAGTSPLASGVQPRLTHNLLSPGPSGVQRHGGLHRRSRVTCESAPTPCPYFPPLDAASGAAKDVSSLSPCNLDFSLSFLPG